MYVCVWGCMDVCGCMHVRVSAYVYRHTWAKGNRERERKSVTRKEIKSAKVRARKSRSEKIRARKTRSAKARERERKSAKFKAQKKRKSASAKGFRRERKSASAKVQKKRVPSSGYNISKSYSYKVKKRQVVEQQQAPPAVSKKICQNDYLQLIKIIRM